jgi:hypothetical protein
MYGEECGPRAVAALLELTPAEAAARLWPVRSFWWNPERPAGGDTIYGTPERAIEDVLLRAGCELDWYGGDGKLLADTGVLAHLIRRDAAERAHSVRRVQTAAQSAPAAPTAPAWLPELSTLAQWLERHGAGWWLYALTNGCDAHVLAAWGSRVIAGDSDGSYASWKVYAALRVHTPKKPYRGEF